MISHVYNPVPIPVRLHVSGENGPRILMRRGRCKPRKMLSIFRNILSSPKVFTVKAPEVECSLPHGCLNCHHAWCTGHEYDGRCLKVEPTVSETFHLEWHFCGRREKNMHMKQTKKIAMGKMSLRNDLVCAAQKGFRMDILVPVAFS